LTTKLRLIGCVLFKKVLIGEVLVRIYVAWRDGLVGHMLVGRMLVGRMLVGRMLVGRMLVGRMLVGRMLVGRMLVGRMLVGRTSVRPYGGRVGDYDDAVKMVGHNCPFIQNNFWSYFWGS